MHKLLGLMVMTSLEICAGAGGQALGLACAGFHHVGLLENDPHACNTLRANRPEWPVLEESIFGYSAEKLRGEVGLLAGGVPCPPFSKAGKQLGREDERDLFPQALRLVAECEPAAVMLENVRGLLDPVFDEYRLGIGQQLADLGYESDWRLLHASDFGVPQLRPRTVLVAIRNGLSGFTWPEPQPHPAPTVGEALFEEMSSRGWKGATHWRKRAASIGPTLVGGSKKHGGPDLGPTRARAAWAVLDVDGRGLADEPPSPGFDGMPRLTVRMTAKLQGFPDAWVFCGGKTAAYRQIGNAFPPPVAEAVARRIYSAIAPRRLELVSAAA
jgi:DNA (cytosine-5)-methyltransferase 1